MRSFTLKFVIYVTAFCLSYFTCKAQYSCKLELKHDYDLLTDSSNKKTKLEEKSPLLAGSLSFIVPGLALGQIYKEDYGKFALHAGISTVIIVFTIAASERGWIQVPFYAEGTPTEESKGGGILALCILSYIGNWMWSTIDAIHTATLKNREIERQRKTGSIMNRLRMDLTFDKNKTPKLKVTFNL